MLLRPRRNPTALTINEPIRDTKGKKRAAPEPTDDVFEGPSTKRPKYSLRSTSTSQHQSEMPRKSRLVRSHYQEYRY